MYIKSLTVDNFRNYDHEQIKLCPTTNVFFGNNAQGKTNLLEAVYLFSHGRSHRTKSDRELIKFGENFFGLDMAFCDSQREYNAKIRVSKEGKKIIKINNVPVKKLSMLMSYLNVVMFSPEDLELVKGAPSVRRKFIDEAVSQLYPKYLATLINYHKSVFQKNSLLKSLKFAGVQSDKVLSAWNVQLANCGAVIYKYRRDFIKKINELAKPIHMDIANEDFEIIYGPGIKLSCDDNELEKCFYDVLEQNQRREIEMGACQIGTQRDDFRLFMNGNEARIYGSQGQQRTCVLTLKIAETEYIKSVREEYPVLLLDDIMSELDVNRRRYLWERITDKQVLLTCTDTDILNSTKNTLLFNIDGGKIIR
ncbi:MAG: DNA replication/repair protein RecF [Clostridia bacterium]|nr:DNA replication/repair protein RecF [Clostridia bacterium]